MIQTILTALWHDKTSCAIASLRNLLQVHTQNTKNKRIWQYAFPDVMIIYMLGAYWNVSHAISGAEYTMIIREQFVLFYKFVAQKKF